MAQWIGPYTANSVKLISHLAETCDHYARVKQSFIRLDNEQLHISMQLDLFMPFPLSYHDIFKPSTTSGLVFNSGYQPKGWYNL